MRDEPQSDVIFRVGQAAQPMPIGDTYGVRGRLTDLRNLTEHTLRKNIGEAIQHAESGQEAVVEVTDAQRGPLLAAIDAEKQDRGLSAELAALERLLLQ